jgi:hypothetical protein
MQFQKSLWIFILIPLALSGLSCARKHVAEFKNISQDGISLVYAAAVFPTCEVKREARLTDQENGTDIPFDVFPARVSFALNDKRVLSSSITVTPLTDTTVANFSQAYPGLAAQVQQLAAILQKRPALPPQRQSIPDLFEIDCERLIISKPQFVDFKSGSGVLFITQYGQEFRGINNKELAYVFQGLTTKRDYFISARFAIGHPTLDRGLDDTKPLSANRQTKYLKHIEQELDFFPDSSFNPPLTDIKLMLATLNISEP